jgi:hypothetical protein
MKCDLEGLLRHAACAIEGMEEDAKVDGKLPWGWDKHNTEYYAFCLREVADNIEKVKKREATLEEFAECYCLDK